jgi:hypothetical protein
MADVWLSCPLDKVELPRVCIKCAAPGTRKTAIERDFRRQPEDGPEHHDVQGLEVWVCEPCHTRHLSEARRIHLLERWFLPLRTWFAIPAVAGGGFAVYFLTRSPGDWAFLALAAVMAVISLFGYLAGRVKNRHLLVIPPTSITSAFVFDEEEGKLFERSRRRFAFENEDYAERFREANARFHYDPNSPANRWNRLRAQVIRKWLGWIVIGALAAFGAWAWYQDTFG